MTHKPVYIIIIIRGRSITSDLGGGGGGGGGAGGT